MEPVYLELVLNDRLIRINKNDSMDVYVWREWTKTPYWFKLKPILCSANVKRKTEYKRYTIHIGKKNYRLSRLVYKAHNPEWDITDNSDTNHIDHININALDNRIENLRILTNQQNQCNRRAKGYYWWESRNKWQVKIKINGKQKTIGYFTEEADAKNAYLEAKEKFHIIA